MANVYFQSSVQLVFAVEHRKALIQPVFQQRLHSYIGGLLINKKHKPLAINSVKDHIHIFFGMYPCDLPALVGEIKSNSSKWINKSKFTQCHFQWQNGYGFFTYCNRHRSNVIQYIDNQQAHHQIETFREEYIGILEEAGIEYDEKYLFEFF